MEKIGGFKPPPGYDSATEDISATFSTLVSMQEFFLMPVVNDLLSGNRGGGPRVFFYLNWHVTEICMP